MKGDGLSEFLSSADEDEDEEVPYNYKYRRLIKKIREYLKTKLPNYSVPNGKFLIIVNLYLFIIMQLIN